jgi:hypothetical protein
MRLELFVGKTPGAALRDIRFERALREMLPGSPDVNIMNVAQIVACRIVDDFPSSIVAV